MTLGLEPLHERIRCHCDLALFIGILVGKTIALEAAVLRHVPECPAELFQSHLLPCGVRSCLDGVCGKDRAARDGIRWQQAEGDQVVEKPPAPSQGSILPPTRTARAATARSVRFLRLRIPAVREYPNPEPFERNGLRGIAETVNGPAKRICPEVKGETIHAPSAVLAKRVYSGIA
ncbi:MAG: hypothetical protein Kow0013_29910 [Pararhodobacter sp.]